MSFNLHIIYTGGTIGSVDNPLGPLPGASFCDAFDELIAPMIRQRYPDAVISYDWLEPTLDSTNLQPVDWTAIAARIIGAPGDTETYANHDAFIVLHGTDTMAWTASALSFLLTGLGADGYANAILSKPVIVTGSQLPLFHRASKDDPLSLLYGTDALRNVLGAVASARTGIAQVGLFFNDVLMQGNRALKVNASEFHAFETPNFPKLATMGIELTVHNRNLGPAPYLSSLALDNADALARAQAQLAHVAENIDGADVLTFLAFPAQYDATQGISALAAMLKGALAADHKIAGLFLEGYGAGNFPSGDPNAAEDSALYQVLKAAHDAGMVIVAGTQLAAGTVNSTTYAAGSWLAEVGAIGNYDMAGPATQAKLLYLLALRDYEDRGWEQDDIEDLMRRPIAFEMMDVNRLDAQGQGTLMAGQSIHALDGSAWLSNDPVKGPVLTDSSGHVLWQPISFAFKGPGRLIMQDDGNLVFYDRTNAAVWATRDFSVGQAASVLILSGSANAGSGKTAAGKAGSLALYVYDYRNRQITATLVGTAPDP